jgi:hypothetical protein
LTRPVLLPVIALALAGCGRTIATTATSQSQLAPPDAFQCAMKQFDELGFQRTMYDKDDLRTSARKVNPGITFSNVQFRKAWDRLDVQVAPGANGTDLKVTPSTVAEYFSQTGPIYNQVKTSEQANQAAQALQRACGAASATAPPPSQQ